MIVVRKTEKSYYDKLFTRSEVIDLLAESLPDEFTVEKLSPLSEQELVDLLGNRIDCFEVTEYLDSELVEYDSGDEWSIELG